TTLVPFESEGNKFASNEEGVVVGPGTNNGIGVYYEGALDMLPELPDGAYHYAVMPDGRVLALISTGDLYVTNVAPRATPLVDESPLTCDNGEKDTEEEGPDCGGPCAGCTDWQVLPWRPNS